MVFNFFRQASHFFPVAIQGRNVVSISKIRQMDFVSNLKFWGGLPGLNKNLVNYIMEEDRWSAHARPTQGRISKYTEQ